LSFCKFSFSNDASYVYQMTGDAFGLTVSLRSDGVWMTGDDV
jgi:hypothetical protein